MSLARDGRKLALVRSSEISCPRGLTRFSSVPLCPCHPERSATISWPLTKGMGAQSKDPEELSKYNAAVRSSPRALSR